VLGNPVNPCVNKAILANMVNMALLANNQASLAHCLASLVKRGQIPENSVYLRYLSHNTGSLEDCRLSQGSFSTLNTGYLARKQCYFGLFNPLLDRAKGALAWLVYPVRANIARYT